MKDKEWQDQNNFFKERLNQNSDNGELWLEYANFLDFESDNPELTLKAILKAKSLLPNKNLELRLGDAYVRAGEIEKGISIINNRLKQKPTASGYCFLAEAYILSDQDESAKRACQIAIDLDPNCEEAYYLLGEATRKESKSEAINLYRKAIGIDPNYQLAWQALGSLLCASEDTLDEGIECLKKAIELDSDDGWAYVYLANAYWKKGDFQKAEIEYKNGIRVFPDYDDMYKWYAEFLVSQGRLSEAEDIIKKAETL